MYTKEYDSDNIRSNNSTFLKNIMTMVKNDMIGVDMGCGTCRKSLELSKFVDRIDCIDNSIDMINVSKSKLRDAECNNIRLFYGDNYNTPFKAKQYDFCIASLTNWSCSEVHRILKTKGFFFLQTLCADDKKELKDVFGCDELGPRGRFLNQTNEERNNYILKSLEPFFEILEFKKEVFTTTLNKEGLIKLLEVTPTIRNFSLNEDLEVINTIAKYGDINFTERRLIITAVAK